MRVVGRGWASAGPAQLGEQWADELAGYLGSCGRWLAGWVRLGEAGWKAGLVVLVRFDSVPLA